nr:hypothetical protein [Tanacetum cinerariifolium]
MWIEEPIGYDKHALWGVSHWERKRQQFYSFAVNWEFAQDVYSKRRIIVVTELKIVEWHNYKHLYWITMRKDDDKLYKFKEGDFKRLRIQDIKDMKLLLVQGKLTNLTVEERFAFNVSLQMFTRSINKDKKNRLMRIDELHKFSDGMLTDVCTALDDRLKGIRMQYSNPIVQPEQEGSTQGYLLVSVEVLRYDKRSKSKNIGIVPTEMELILEHTQQGISHEVSETLKGRWRYPILAEPQIHNHMLIPDYQDIIFQDFRYSDGFECYQAIKIG